MSVHAKGRLLEKFLESFFIDFSILFQLYIILIRPERNIRQSMMTANRVKGLSKPPTTGSTSMMSTVMVTVTTCNQKEKIQRHMSIVDAKAVQYNGE